MHTYLRFLIIVVTFMGPNIAVCGEDQPTERPACSGVLATSLNAVMRPREGFWSQALHIGRAAFSREYRRFAILLQGDARFDEKKRRALIQFLNHDLDDPKISKDFVEEVFVMNLHLIQQGVDATDPERTNSRNLTVSREDSLRFLSKILAHGDRETLKRLMSLKVPEPKTAAAEPPVRKGSWLGERRSILYALSWHPETKVLYFHPQQPRLDFFNEVVLALTIRLDGLHADADSRSSLVIQDDHSPMKREGPNALAFFDSLSLPDQMQLLELDALAQRNSSQRFKLPGNDAVKADLRNKLKTQIFTAGFVRSLEHATPSDVSKLKAHVDSHHLVRFAGRGAVDYVSAKPLNVVMLEEARDEAKFETELGAIVYRLLRYRLLTGLQNPSVSKYETIVMAEEAAVGLKLVFAWAIERRDQILTEAFYNDVFQALQLTAQKSKDTRTPLQIVEEYDPELTLPRLASMAVHYNNQNLASATVDATKPRFHDIFSFVKDVQPELLPLIEAQSLDDVKRYFDKAGSPLTRIGAPSETTRIHELPLPREL